MTEPTYKLGALTLNPDEMAALDRLDRVMGTRGLSSEEDRFRRDAVSNTAAIGGGLTGMALGSQSLGPKLTAGADYGRQVARGWLGKPSFMWYSTAPAPKGGKGGPTTQRSPLASRVDRALGMNGLAREGDVDALGDAVRDFIRNRAGHAPQGGAYAGLDRQQPWAERQRLLRELLSSGSGDLPSTMTTGNPGVDDSLRALRQMNVLGSADKIGPNASELLKGFGSRLMANHPLQRPVFLPRTPGKPTLGENVRQMLGRAVGEGSGVAGRKVPQTLLGRVKPRGPMAGGLLGAGLGLVGGAAVNKLLDSDIAEGVGRRLESLWPSAGSNRGSFTMDEVRKALGL